VEAFQVSQDPRSDVPVPEAVVARFQALLDQARQAEIPEPSAMSLATVSPAGAPSVRTVLLKSWSACGIDFYTNLNSCKARHLEAHPQAAVCFYWGPLWRQVLMEGGVERQSDRESDAYWETRPRDHQLGAWSSSQSQPLSSRDFLESEYRRYELFFEGRPIPRPPYWGGFHLHPTLIEFWSGQAGRLHERDRYTVVEGRWTHQLYFP
jgi:pyridoxamine 5'-phosphate oxidase